MKTIGVNPRSNRGGRRSRHARVCVEIMEKLVVLSPTLPLPPPHAPTVVVQFHPPQPCSQITTPPDPCNQMGLAMHPPEPCIRTGPSAEPPDPCIAMGVASHPPNPCIQTSVTLHPPSPCVETSVGPQPPDPCISAE
jgi:hypothetical protein